MSGLLANKLTNANPALLIELPGMAVVKASGPDTDTFLQGQLTCDLTHLEQHNWLLGGHCDAKGKLWSIFRAVRSEDSILLLQNRSTAEHSLAQLQKFSVFSKIEITDSTEHFSCFLVAGEQAVAKVSELVGGTPTELHSTFGDTHVLSLSPTLYLCVTPKTNKPNARMLPESYWHAIQIEQGWPNLAAVHQSTFIPQMVNLDSLNGVSFKKGCYIGQETIARTHYKGQNKRRLAHLIGTAESTPAPASELEIKLGENWRRAGAVISAVRYDNDVIAIQAVLPSDLDAQAELRIKGQNDSKFTPCPKSDETESINE
ncbi:tRNA-modifying protein YgfZ [Aliidiomarina iranensis]|uniref:tRNA-modifying protein YgfZ n=1 Tax=Aliidiomarina iranensis TaxID=1434071 RepID=A0A432W0K3_9GAMM|nr:tRNA-modifying protein YgfZ [Aliidiomarina iranensis]RUO22523.1 tRNA-modifying protein YgfZ [Aliidiomarina iranensis]